jgi:hypothetical protein
MELANHQRSYRFLSCISASSLAAVPGMIRAIHGQPPSVRR